MLFRSGRRRKGGEEEMTEGEENRGRERGREGGRREREEVGEREERHTLKQTGRRAQVSDTESVTKDSSTVPGLIYSHAAMRDICEQFCCCLVANPVHNSESNLIQQFSDPEKNQIQSFNDQEINVI